MEPPEIVEVSPGEEISCDGGQTYGHPKVYLTLGDDGHVDCYYCGRRFQVNSKTPIQAAGDG
jgi:uncharacterized Zn-finger protein